jgi:hypothetical protein
MKVKELVFTLKDSLCEYLTVEAEERMRGLRAHLLSLMIRSHHHAIGSQQVVTDIAQLEHVIPLTEASCTREPTDVQRDR